MVSNYNLHGESILIKDRNKVLSPDTKLEIINRLKKGEPQNRLIIEYCVTAKQIHKWLKNYEEFSYNGLIDKPKGRSPTMNKGKNIHYLYY